MDLNRAIETNIEAKEKERIAEIKSLSYLERLERLFTIVEVSYMLRTAEKIQVKKTLKRV